MTFLGKGRENTETGYRKTIYAFPDNSEAETPFFGIALATYIQPDRTVIVGTRSSQWGVLVENLATQGRAEDARIQLLDAETRGAVEQEHLNAVTELVATALKCEVALRLIPFGRDEDEQYEILDVIATNVSDGTLHFDLTHGFRHFGMVGFLSAFMLARVRELTVKTLWYGALEMTRDGITPVLQLDGLDRVRQWLDALNRFDATGDYRVFGGLLIKDGVEKEMARHLENAAFYERMLNLDAAAEAIRQFQPVLARPLKGASGLFQKRLTERLEWVNLETFSEQQTQLAWQYLRRRDYLRAVLFAREAVDTRVYEKRGLNPRNPAIRQNTQVSTADVVTWLGDGEGQAGGNPIAESFETLNEIRNALAHITSQQRSTAVFADEQEFVETLKQIFRQLLPAVPEQADRTL